jgi:cyclopropane-fatty-acyl-phospholipid synthase
MIREERRHSRGRLCHTGLVGTCNLLNHKGDGGLKLHSTLAYRIIVRCPVLAPANEQVPGEKMAMANTWFDRCLLDSIKRMSQPVQVHVEMGAASPGYMESTALPVIRIRDRRALFALLCNPSINFGELYSQGRLEVEGDLIHLLENLYRVPQGVVARIASRYLGWTQSSGRRASRKNIYHHYDIANDFYQLWLDPQMVYTCAYFPHQKANLEDAQSAKLDLVCRKLWLQPGETVVEAGCGWGALALHMAKFYGVRVRAFNISEQQIQFARERAKREGLESLVEFVDDDYRNIRGRYDAFVSLGMLEHVGRAHYRDLGRVIHRVIGDQGRGLLHFIGKNRPQPLSAWIRRRIFPGGYCPALREVMDVLEPHDFGVLDVENLRFHYARTLEHWLQRFEHSYEGVVERYGTFFARMWRLYLAGSAAAFRAGTMQLFQVVFSGRSCNPQPWTREHLYQEASEQDVEWIHATS